MQVLNMAGAVLRRISQIPSRGFPHLGGTRHDEFDRRYGVRTAEAVNLVRTDSPNLKHGHRYQALRESAIRWAIEHCGLPLEESILVDIGCGRGRVLIVGCDYPFRFVLGVEYSPGLAEDARRNLRRCQLNAEVVTLDAMLFPFPQSPALVFLFNPFDSTLMRRFIPHVPDTARIAYCGPDRAVIEAAGWTPIASADGMTIYHR